MNQLVGLHAVPHPSAPVRQAGFPLDHPYLEQCWAPGRGGRSLTSTPLSTVEDDIDIDNDIGAGTGRAAHLNGGERLPRGAGRHVGELALPRARAVDDERIARNPAKGARLAKAETVPLVPMTPEQVRAISHSMAEHVRCAVVVAAGTGLRQGELFGLGSDRVDFMRRELRVDRQLWTPAKGRPFLKAPKSANSYRTIG